MITPDVTKVKRTRKLRATIFFNIFVFSHRYSLGIEVNMQGRVFHKNDRCCKITRDLFVFKWAGSARKAGGHDGLRTKPRMRRDS